MTFSYLSKIIIISGRITGLVEGMTVQKGEAWDDTFARVCSMVTGNPRSREKTRKKQGQGMGGLRF